MNQFIPKFIRYIFIVLGSALFAIGTNLFIVPEALYSGGILGLIQVLRTLLIQYLPFQIPEGLDIAGIMNFLVNIPLLYMAYKYISRSFLFTTLLSLVASTVLFSMVPITKTPILDDVLASCIIGGVLTGAGIGIVLRFSGSSGGLDIIGLILAKKYKNFSVGKLSMFFNSVLYLICAFIFDMQIAIYSILYVLVFSFVVDRIHLQNISVSAMVFTKKEGIDKLIMNRLGRGVTKCEGTGAYTGEGTQLLFVVISKHEIREFKDMVFGMDSQAFVTFNEVLAVHGNFIKKF